MIPLWKPFDEKFERLGQGEDTASFEEKIGDFLNVKYAVAVSNGTAALFLALKGYDVHEGFRVAVPDLTAMGTINAVTMTGARPTLASLDGNGCLDFNSMSESVDVAIVVHFNGRTAEFPKDVIVIEDACQALGSQNEDGKYLGSIGECGCFSFSPTKTIYTGQGGLVVTNHRWLYDKVKMLRDQGRHGKTECYSMVGYNFKFTDLQARLALEQLQQIDAVLDRKKQIYSMYHEHLGKWMYPVLPYQVIWLPDIYVEERDKLHKELLKKGISTRLLYPPIHTQPAYLTKKDFPKAEWISENGLWLPSNVSNDEIAYISKTIKDFLQESVKN